MGEQKSLVEVGKELSLSGFGEQKVVSDRITPMIEISKGRRVLNIGCLGSDVLVDPDPFQGKIARVADYCVGIDIFEAGIEKLRADGYNVVSANAEYMDLDEKDFDLALMGDVIEHVSNPGLVLDSVNRHLIEGGLVAITTPNPFSLSLMLRIALGKPYLGNTEHVFWFDTVMLAALLERSGFEVVESWWTEQSRFAPLRMMQQFRNPLHGTFGLVARKVRSIPTRGPVSSAAAE